jgi:CopG family nickel-responsive transcriptional regulator
MKGSRYLWLRNPGVLSQRQRESLEVLKLLGRKTARASHQIKLALQELWKHEDRLVAEEWKVGTGETVGTVTLVYSHDTRELTETLNELQHHHHTAIISTVHVHLDEHNCLEVLILRGKGDEIKAIADKLIGTKGVKHGKLSVTTTGKGIE